jgi:hypothetical protein
MGGVVGEALETPLEVVEPVELRLGDRGERGRITRCGQERAEVVDAERDPADDRRPDRVRGALDEPTERGLDSDSPLLAGRAGRTPTRGREPLPAATSPSRERVTEAGGASLDDRAVEDRRAEDPGRPAFGGEQLDDVASAEPVVALEARPEPDVENALGDDRLERGALGPRSNGTCRAAALPDRGGQPDVDEVRRRKTARFARPAHLGTHGVKRLGIDRLERATGPRDAKSRVPQEPVGDPGTDRPVERIMRVPFGHGDEGFDRAGGGPE